LTLADSDAVQAVSFEAVDLTAPVCPFVALRLPPCLGVLVDLQLADSGDDVDDAGDVTHNGGRGDLRPADARPTDVRDTVSARSSSPQFPSSSGTDMAINYIRGSDRSL
jgi:hypothetical protein